jgi:hypothetical protein
MDYLRTDEERVDFETINNMFEFLQCYPLEVRKSKNASAQMEDVMNLANKV